jgi:hypothetical protein
VPELEVLIRELLAVDGLASGAVAAGEVTRLAHEVRDDAVEDAVLVAEGLARPADPLLAGAQRPEVLARLRGDVDAELERDAADGRAADAHVEETTREGRHGVRVRPLRLRDRNCDKGAASSLDHKHNIFWNISRGGVILERRAASHPRNMIATMRTTGTAVHASSTTTTLAARRAARSTGVTAGRRTATNATPVVHRSMASLGGKRTLGTLGRATHVVTRAQGDDEPQTRGGDDEPDRDEDGLYIGTYSNFFTDPDQLKGVVIFCAFLASFLSLGNIGAAILLPILYDQPISTCIQGILFGYYCPGQDGPLP